MICKKCVHQIRALKVLLDSVIDSTSSLRLECCCRCNYFHSYTGRMKVYLDHNATTPLERDVVEVIKDALIEAWGNPSSKNEIANLPKKLLDESRENVARLINASKSEIIFTSGGTESNHLAIHSALQEYKSWLKSTPDTLITGVPHVISVLTEHPSVIKPLEVLKSKAELDVTFLSVEKNNGVLEDEFVLHHIRPNTCLICIMLANNETGIISPLIKLSRSLKHVNKIRESSGLFPILLHSDAAQAIGKMEVDMEEINCDYLTIVGHKFYGPRIGALYIRRRGKSWPAHPLLYGGGQELGIRSGTENIPLIAGLGKAAHITKIHLQDHLSHMAKIRNYLEAKLKDTFQDLLTINFVDVDRLVNTTSVTFDLPPGCYGYHLLKSCKCLIASTASSCHNEAQPSEVLMFSGLDREQASRTVRLSVGRTTTEDDIDLVISDLQSAYLACVPSEGHRNVFKSIP